MRGKRFGGSCNIWNPLWLQQLNPRIGGYYYLRRRFLEMTLFGDE
jgi:hypothetical protein